MDAAALESAIESAWDNRDSIDFHTTGETRDAVDTALEQMDGGALRVAEKRGGDWHVNQWAKKAVLLSFRLNDKSAFGGGTGLEDRVSDVVGRITIAPNARFAYTFRYRVDVDGPKLDRHEHLLNYTGEKFEVAAGYISLPRIGNGVAVGNTEEISLKGSAQVTENWRIASAYRGDLSGDGAIRLEGGIQYLDECFDFNIGAVRDFTNDRDAEASTSVFVRFRLKGLN